MYIYKNIYIDMCVYINIYMHMHTHIYIFICIYIYIYKCTVYTHICTLPMGRVSTKQ